MRKARGFLDRRGISGEVVVADNGSTDGSQKLAERCGARVVPIPRRGYGAALLGGIHAARGTFVVMGDGDDSYDFTALDPFLEKLRGGVELVMGNRFLGGIQPNAMPPLHKYLGNPVLTGVGRLFFRSPCGDFHCGLRGFRRESILSWASTSPGMEFASEMVVKATLRNCHRRSTDDPGTDMVAADRRTCAAGGMGGAICDSCCCSVRIGSFFMQFALPLVGAVAMTAVAARAARVTGGVTLTQYVGVYGGSDRVRFSGDWILMCLPDLCKTDQGSSLRTPWSPGFGKCCGSRSGWSWGRLWSSWLGAGRLCGRVLDGAILRQSRSAAFLAHRGAGCDAPHPGTSDHVLELPAEHSAVGIRGDWIR